MKFSPYTDWKITLPQEAWHIVEIACPDSVPSVSKNFFDQSESGQAFNCCINSFLIHTAFFCNDSPRGKTGTVHAVAVPEQTAVDSEISRLQFQFKDTVWNHKEIFVIQLILFSLVLILNFDTIICNSTPFKVLCMLSQAKQKDPHIRRS